jgi:NAD(P)-dependent dehydrogenase (short-subunit alcohol dehydrogenase family)
MSALVKFGTIDVLVNSAGYGHFGPFEEASADDVARQFDVNLFGSMHVTRAMLPVMRSKRAGRIFNISSIVGLKGFGMGSLYCGSKFALLGWSETLSMELEPLAFRSRASSRVSFAPSFSAAAQRSMSTQSCRSM